MEDGTTAALREAGSASNPGVAFGPGDRDLDAEGFRSSADHQRHLVRHCHRGDVRRRGPGGGATRYDADQTVAAFAARLKDAVGLDSVRDDLSTVVQQALEPAHLSVWISRRT